MNTTPQGDENASRGSRFPETLWTRVRRAHNPGDPDAARKAFGQLCGEYWSPLYAYARAIGLAPADAQRLVNELFYRMTWELFPTHHPEMDLPEIPEGQRPIGKQRDNGNATPLLERAEDFAVKNRARHGPQAGRLRDFFMLQIKSIAHSDWRTNSRRSKDSEVFSIDDVSKVESELHDDFKAVQSSGSPDEVFLCRWRRTLLRRARMALQQEMEDKGDGERFQVLWPLVDKEDHGGLTSEGAGRLLGMSDGNVRVMVTRMRAKLRDHILSQIAGTLESDDPADLQAEIRALFSSSEIR